jgi:hypothetical protein
MIKHGEHLKTAVWLSRGALRPSRMCKLSYIKYGYLISSRPL